MLAAYNCTVRCSCQSASALAAPRRKSSIDSRTTHGTASGCRRRPDTPPTALTFRWPPATHVAAPPPPAATRARLSAGPPRQRNRPPTAHSLAVTIRPPPGHGESPDLGSSSEPSRAQPSEASVAEAWYSCPRSAKAPPVVIATGYTCWHRAVTVRSNPRSPFSGPRRSPAETSVQKTRSRDVTSKSC